MAFKVDDNGNITLIQGDSGQLTIIGLPTDKDYVCYFAIQNANREPIGNEVVVNANRNELVVFHISASLTDLLIVPKNDESAEYYYGVKICYANDYLEDTLLLGDSNIGDLNTITVYPKKVEGTVQWL